MTGDRDSLATTLYRITRTRWLGGVGGLCGLFYYTLSRAWLCVRLRTPLRLIALYACPVVGLRLGSFANAIVVDNGWAGGAGAGHGHGVCGGARVCLQGKRNRKRLSRVVSVCRTVVPYVSK